jgi:beta-aspartyl-peptidase (threonine type)
LRHRLSDFIPLHDRQLAFHGKTIKQDLTEPSLHGSVGDSPLIGCGCYADAETGGVSSTGYGEAIMRVVMAKTAADFLRPANSTPNRAAQAAVQLLANRGEGTGGLILLDKNGNPGFAFNTPRMAFGYVNDESSFTSV